MARQPRLEFDEAVIWVRSAAPETRPLFRDDGDRARFVSLLRNVTEFHGWSLWLWTLLDDEYHLVVRTDSGTLSSALRDLNAGYARMRRGDGAGRVFAGRYRALVVEPHAYLAPLAGWLLHLPVARALASRPSRWKWSAYPDLVRVRQSILPIQRGEFLGALGGRPDAPIRLREAVAAASREWWSPDEHVVDQRVLGSRAFLESLGHTRKTEAGAGVPASRVISAVAAQFGLPPGEIRRGRGGEARAAAALLLREGGHTLEEVGEVLGITGSGVSRLSSAARRLARSGEPGRRIALARAQCGLGTQPRGGSGE